MPGGRIVRTVSATGAVALLCVLTAGPATADEIRNSQWPLQQYQVAKSVWTKSKGEGVTVAVIDTGVNASHPDLVGQVLPGKDFTAAGGDGRIDQIGHGTGMASLIAGHGHGVGEGISGLAPEAKILPVRIGLRKGAGDRMPRLAPGGNEEQLADAIRYSVDQGADVISVSIAGVSSQPAVREAVGYAIEKDVVVVAAAGNGGKPDVEYPAAYPGVVAVGAVTVEGKLWKGSNYGPEIALTAPGEEIIYAVSDSATTGYGWGAGTSPATAYVAGAAALVRAAFPDLSAGQVINRLLKSAAAPKDGTKVPSKKYGAGILDPGQALNRNIPAGPKKNPLLDRRGNDEASPSASSANTGSNRNTAATVQSADQQGSHIVLIVAIIAAVIVGLTAVALVRIARKPIA